jgi:hypothetical protein
VIASGVLLAAASAMAASTSAGLAGFKTDMETPRAGFDDDRNP